jgi:hypothetical protein
MEWIKIIAWLELSGSIVNNRILRNGPAEKGL